MAVVAAGLSEGVDDDESASSDSTPGVGPVATATVDPTSDGGTGASAPLPATSNPATTTTTTTTTTSTVSTTTTSSTTTSSTTTTTSTTSTVAPPPTVPAVVDQIRRRLDSLTTADPDPSRGAYIRDEFGGWSDTDGDCMTTRHELLTERSLVPVTLSADGCRVETGRWLDPFTGDLLTTAEEATIDHQVPLAEAHRSGAWRWDADTKERFANDVTPGALNIVGGEVNQSKADRSPDEWLPPLESTRCTYASSWIDTKARWALSVTAREVDALDAALDSCTAETAPTEVPFDEARVTTTVPPPPTTLPPITSGSGPGRVVLVSCEKRSEEVVVSNPGDGPVDLDGFVLHDEGRKHETPLGQWGPLQPGSRLTIVTGDGATAGEARVVWKGQNVWNNDGDTANLIAPDGTITTAAC